MDKSAEHAVQARTVFIKRLLRPWGAGMVQTRAPGAKVLGRAVRH